MKNDDSYYCAIGFNNKLRYAFLKAYLFVFHKKVLFYNTVYTRKLFSDGLIKSGRVRYEDKSIGEIKGGSYRIHTESIDLTSRFADKYLRDTRILRHLNKSMRSSKFDCYTRKKIVYDVAEVLTGLYLVEAFAEGKKVMLIDSLLNRFVVSEFLRGKDLRLDIRWVNFSLISVLQIFIYYAYLIKKLFKAGVIFKEREKVKVFKESTWGLTYPIFRDDFIIDNDRFKKTDILFYYKFSYGGRGDAAKQLKTAGYTVVDMNTCPLNIKGRTTLFLDIFILKPFLSFMTALCSGSLHQAESVIKFYIESLPYFLFLSNYEAKCHISSSDHGEVAETIIMNRLGCKNVVYHWSDMTSLRANTHAFTAHNIYYSWGDIHHNFQKEDYYHDKVVVIGCMALKLYFDSLEKYKEHNVKRTRKKVLVCDTSFADTSEFPEDFYLDYLGLFADMLQSIPAADFIFKPKHGRATILNAFTDDAKREACLASMNRLDTDGRVTYCDSMFQVEEFMACADVVVTMGMTSPSTIALMLHKEAVYYDPTGNKQHPMTRYKGKVVFEDRKSLISGVKAILNAETSVFDHIDKDLLRGYEPYGDSKALDRLRSALYNEIEGPR